MAFVVFAGQSNTGGYGMGEWTLPAPWTPDPLSLIWQSSTQSWVPLQPGVNTGYGGQPNAWGPETPFAQAFRAEHPGEVLYIVKEAHGGTGLARDTAAWHYDWSPLSSGELFDAAASTIAAAGRAAGGVKPDAVFFGQGEADASNWADAAAYQSNLEAFVAAARSGWMNDPAGKVGLFFIGPNWPFAMEVRARQAEVDRADPNVASFDTRSLVFQGDAQHFAAAGYQAIGRAYAQMFELWRAEDALPVAVRTAFQQVLRADAFAAPTAALAQDLANRLSSGAMHADQALGAVVRAADATTSVATLAYQFFTGKIPSLGGIDYLVSPTGPNPNNLNSAYYQGFNLENRYINFAVNLGKEGEGKAQFAAAYGGLTLSQATKKAYEEIFGLAPTDAKVAALLSGGRDLYFEAYGRDGANGVGTKAAMVGWLLAEAEKGDIGMYARSNAAFLTDLADGAPFAVDLVGTYGKGEFDYGG